MKEIEIVIFHENHSYGGGEKMLLWVAKTLFSKGIKVRFCCLYDSEDMDLSPVPADYLHFKFSSSYFIRNIRYFTIGFFRLYNYIRKHHVKDAICFGFNSFYILGILKHFMGFKLLVSERGDPTRKRLSILRKYLFAGSDVAVFQTNGAKRFYDKNNEESSFVIPNPVSIPNNTWKNCNDSFNVISVGRIDFEQKRQDLLIEAFHIVVKEVPSAKLIIVGKGYDENRLKSMIDEYDMSDAVILKGFQKDVFYEMANANVFVLTSDYEGIPNALLEAMSFGMPVVSTDCTPGGAAMLIRNGENGYLVERGNPNQIADAIVSLMKDESLRNKFGSLARKDMSQFNEDVIIERWEEAIHKLINK